MPHARADGQRIEAVAFLDQARDLAGVDATALAFGEGDHPRFRYRDAEPERDAVRRRNAQLAGPCPQRADAGEQSRARQFAAAGDEHRHPALVLVSLLGRLGEREAAQQFGIEQARIGKGDITHRAATIASGSDVTGVASSISGAAKL